jgi:hypothetical protein
MDTAYRDLKNPPHRLPDITLVDAIDGTGRKVRATGRWATVLLILHGEECQPCRALTAALAERRHELEEWEARVRIVVTADSSAPGRSEGVGAGAFDVLLDPERRLTSRLGLAGPAVVIADRWGVIRSADPAPENHALPSPDEIVGWVRFLAIECPECEGEAF